MNETVADRGLEGRPCDTHSVSRFAGGWRVRRRVIDHLAKRHYLFAGTATITHDAFVERGDILVDERSFKAERRYRLAGSGDAIEILFPDGRPFLKLDGRPNHRVKHLCGDDLYTGRLFFVGPDLWVEFWRVHGPRKCHTSLTRFERG